MSRAFVVSLIIQIAFRRIISWSRPLRQLSTPGTAYSVPSLIARKGLRRRALARKACADRWPRDGHLQSGNLRTPPRQRFRSAPADDRVSLPDPEPIPSFPRTNLSPWDNRAA